jgi:hypothetical protein
VAVAVTAYVPARRRPTLMRLRPLLRYSTRRATTVLPEREIRTTTTAGRVITRRSVVVSAARLVSLTEAKATVTREGAVVVAPGALSDASAAGPASPQRAVAVAHAVPEPATGVIVPPASTLRMRLRAVSAIR